MGFFCNSEIIKQSERHNTLVIAISGKYSDVSIRRYYIVNKDLIDFTNDILILSSLNNRNNNEINEKLWNIKKKLEKLKDMCDYIYRFEKIFYSRYEDYTDKEWNNEFKKLKKEFDENVYDFKETNPIDKRELDYIIVTEIRNEINELKQKFLNLI